MPKLILRCNYLKNAQPSHLANYINYISTREGVEKVSDTNSKLPATARQKDLIEDILKRIEDADRMHEYYDYIQRPTRENASEFITQALENNLDLIAKKKNYIDYLANRPGVEKIGTHGLFSDEGKPIVLSRVMDEVAGHNGVIWTNVISLRREDAQRLGYDSAEQWQSLLRSRVQLLCENYKIDGKNLRWYAAFHNESHHPHVHLVLYSAKPSEGYLSKNGIEAMRSVYAHDIFRQEFMSIYEKKGQYRKQVKEQAEESLLFLLEQMKNGLCRNKQIEQDMHLLSKRLMNTGGKKVYGYLKKDVKAIVNRIVDELVKDESVAECYRRWCESKNQIILYYKDHVPEPVPLSEQKELKSIKNMVIQEAVRFGKDYFYVDEDYEDFFENDPAKTDDVYETADTDEGNHPFDEKIGLYAESKHRTRSLEYYIGKMYLISEEGLKNIELAVKYLSESADSGNQYAQYLLGKLYLIGKDVPQDREKAYEYFNLAAEQGNVYAAYFLEHWNDMPHPDLLLMTTRLMKHLEQLLQEDIKKRDSRGNIDRKLARKLRAKKIAQGHARNDHEEMVQTQ